MLDRGVRRLPGSVKAPDRGIIHILIPMSVHIYQYDGIIHFLGSILTPGSALHRHVRLAFSGHCGLQNSLQNLQIVTDGGYLLTAKKNLC